MRKTDDVKKLDEAEMKTLIEAAIAARAQSYSPYSGYAVGVALLADDGTIYAGCNVENAAYPLSFCAEANAIGNMVAAGGRQIVHVVVTGPGTDICTPCGGCRQQIREFASSLDTPVTICDASGAVLLETNIGTLLPNSFGPENLKTPKLQSRN